MANHKIQCPKCNDEMIQGFVPDYNDKGTLVASWQSGHPKASFWGGTKAPKAQGIPIAAFRCQKCGFLEFYADPKFSAQ